MAGKQAPTFGEAVQKAVQGQKKIRPKAEALRVKQLRAASMPDCWVNAVTQHLVRSNARLFDAFVGN